MKRIVLMTCIVGLLAPVAALSQKVYMDGDRVILDMSVGAGMPAEAVTNESKTYWYNTVNPNETDFTIIGTEINDVNHSLNATVFKKLEIAPSGLTKDGTFDSNGDLIKWGDAFTKCKNANHNGEGWRLPTQRELMMMYLFKTALNNFLTIGLLNNYWSSTESGNDGKNAFTVVFNATRSGHTTSYPKSQESYRARCVREILDPN